MGAGFIRRFTFDPGNEELLAVEGVVIIDREPPAQLTGVGTGMVTLVAEFEDGPFEPYQIASSSDFLKNFGSFGFTYAGTTGNNPCARARKADGALTPEFWNGNGFVALTQKRFRQLNVVRVDTTVGYVEFRRLAALKGAEDFTFDLEPGQLVAFNNGGTNTATATFAATAPVITSAAGTFPSTFTGGEHLTVSVDGTQFVIVFEGADQSQAQAITRMNTMLGYTAFADAGGGKTAFTGRQRGTGGKIQIVDQSTLVATALGFSVAAAVAGTGDAANIDAVTLAEANTVFVAAAAAAAVPFVVALIRDENSNLLLVNTSTPLTGELNVTSVTATALGFAVGQSAHAALGTDGTLPAGTLVQDSGAHKWVAAQSVAVTASNAGPYKVLVRPALDDTTTVGASAGTVTVLPTPVPTIGMFSVVNPLPLTAALTDPQLDAKYQDAIDATVDLSSIVKQTNVIVSARQSNSIRTALRTNAIEASSEGCYGRMTVIRPPLGTTRAAAKSTVAQPGVGAYRDRRLVYAYPGATIQIPQIASVGVAGGAGFSNDGITDVGFDMWVASVMSQLPPEENPGQLTQFMSQIIGVESRNADVQGMGLGDYRAFKAAGIAALRIDSGVAIIQSGITSVDPLQQPSLKNIARQRMADFITDTLSIRLNNFVKLLASRTRRALIVGEIDSFMSTLRSDANPANQRIAGYLLDALSANTPETLAAGLFRIILKVRTLPSMDVIVLDTQVGESVNITQLAA